jgi:hypothetical protein
LKLIPGGFTSSLPTISLCSSISSFEVADAVNLSRFLGESSFSYGLELEMFQVTLSEVQAT